MIADELRSARARLGVSGAAFAAAFGVHERTVRSWEGAAHNGALVPIPLAVAVLVECALKSAPVRRRLGFPGKLTAGKVVEPSAVPETAE